MEERLRYILSTVNRWLEFAEKKNGALLVADSAVVFAILALLKDGSAPQIWMAIGLYSAQFLLILSALCSLTSFFPKRHIPWLASRRQASETDNLLFYGDIANYDPSGYLRALYSQCNPKDETLPIEEDYAGQIVMNSRIAVWKYQCSNGALWIMTGALVVLAVVGAGYVASRFN